MNDSVAIVRESAAVTAAVGAPWYAAHVLAVEAERAESILAGRGGGSQDVATLWPLVAELASKAAEVLDGDRSPALAASVLDDVIGVLECNPRLKCPDAVRLVVYVVRLSTVLAELAKLRKAPGELPEIGFRFQSLDALAFAVTGSRQSARAAALRRVVEAGRWRLWTVDFRGRSVAIVPVMRLRPGFARELPRGRGRSLVPVPPFPPLFGSSSVHFRAAVLYLRVFAAIAEGRNNLRGLEPRGAAVRWAVLAERCELSASALQAHVDGWRGELYKPADGGGIWPADRGALALLAAIPKGALTGKALRSDRRNPSVRSPDCFGQKPGFLRSDATQSHDPRCRIGTG
ncbi:MAG: hypothetical protein IV100_09105 [Myxococcales bacterium]|nr:hypothetical protein [Myxococcales bacterium]